MSENQNSYRTHITAGKTWSGLQLKEVWRYRDLILLFTKRDFAVLYKQTVLGPAWILLSPLLSSLVYAFVFGGIAGISTDGVPALLFYLSGNALWTFFAACIHKNAAAFTANANVFGKVYFPRLVVPVSNVLSAIIQLAVQMVPVLVLLIYYAAVGAVRPNWAAWLLIPVELLQLGLLGLGCGLTLSSVTARFRDLNHLVTLGVQLLMYVTPIVYPLSQVGEGLAKEAILLNPATAPVELIRYALLGQGEVLPGYLVYSWCLTLGMLAFGILLFNRVEKTFLDTV